MKEIDRFLTPGLIGHYESFEVFEVFGICNREVKNIFSLIVSSQKELSQKNTTPRIINEKRIKIKNLDDWDIGIQTYHTDADKLKQAIVHQKKENESWALSGKSLTVSNLEYRPPRFVPSDQADLIPLNRILKNNFWSGSHILEIANTSKNEFSDFFKNPELLEALDEKVQQYLPISFSALTDRLGHIIIQFPSEVLAYEFSKKDDKLSVKIDWYDAADKRELDLIVVSDETDKILPNFKLVRINSEQHVIGNFFSGLFKAYFWDSKEDLVVAATSSSGFFDRFGFEIGMGNPEPRTFVSSDDAEVVINVQGKPITSMVGSPQPESEKWTRKRMFSDELKLLKKNKEFIQYGLNRNGTDEHRRAMDDIRTLISKYGKHGILLWDPYLDANDILDTLFYCPYSSSQLKALTAGRTYVSDSIKNCIDSLLQDKSETTKTENWLSKQRNILEEKKGNCNGLNLSFKISRGLNSRKFHDRFIIFQNSEDRANAWSLGTSVNSLGRQHHILQKVTDGALIENSFLNLWNQLNAPENDVWTSIQRRG